MDEKIIDPDFCEEAAIHIGPDCGKCESERVQLLGYYTKEGDGLFLGVKCHKCGAVTETGDSHFYLFYKIDEGQIIPLSDDEIRSSEALKERGLLS